MRISLFLAFLLWPVVAFAQVPAVGGTCTTAGMTATSSNAAGVINTLYCNGSNWVTATLKIGNTITSCTSAVAGAVSWDGTSMKYCDGSSWQTLVDTPPQGYFVMTNSTYSGNLGGLSGANTICRNELTTNSWKNKPATLDTSKIFAFLCNSTTCQTPAGNTNFKFAVAGIPSYGGASMTTNASGLGPGEQTNDWSGSTYFGAYYQYWLNRDMYSNQNYWSTQPYPAGYATVDNSCTEWTSTNSYNSSLGGGIAGGFAISQSTNVSRYYGSNLGQCSDYKNLICFVNP